MKPAIPDQTLQILRVLAVRVVEEQDRWTRLRLRGDDQHLDSEVGNARSAYDAAKRSLVAAISVVSAAGSAVAKAERLIITIRSGRKAVGGEPQP